MGRLLVILLVMLLPLRGWGMERMAIQMVQSPVVLEVADVQTAMAAMPADCPMMVQATSVAHKSASPSKSHSGCHTCQLCMSLAAQEDLTVYVPVQEMQTLLMPLSANFISADLARQAKPPIL